MDAAVGLPSLTLEITKGPREGDVLTYQPSTDPIVRIGRLVRGNSLPIKDVGISSKHLIIHFQPDSCKWILTDLDSSNGTFVNGSSVGMEAGKGYVVGDGDRVKIGESTDFVCRVSGGGKGRTGLGLRRNPRRRGNLGEEKDGVRVLEEIGNGNGGGEEGVGLEEKRPLVRRRGRKEVGVGFQSEAKGKENSAVARVVDSSEIERAKEEVNLGESESERKLSQDCRVVAAAESKRRRGGRKDEDSKGVVVKREPLEDPVEVERVVQVVENCAVAARASTRRTRGKAKKEDQLLDRVLENDGLACGDNGVVSMKTRTGLQGHRKNVHATEESKRLDVIEELVDGAIENKDNEAILNSKEKERVDPLGIQKESTCCDDTADVREEIVSEAKSDAMGNERLPDLSKITVREWLDWLESNLPKQIIAETEKLIEEMRSKARRVKEYRAEQMMKREVK